MYTIFNLQFAEQIHRSGVIDAIHVATARMQASPVVVGGL